MNLFMSMRNFTKLYLPLRLPPFSLSRRMAFFCFCLIIAGFPSAHSWNFVSPTPILNPFSSPFFGSVRNFLQTLPKLFCSAQPTIHFLLPFHKPRLSSELFFILIRKVFFSQKEWRRSCAGISSFVFPFALPQIFRHRIKSWGWGCWGFVEILMEIDVSSSLDEL